MDLQFVRDGYAASKYILGYVLKSDNDVKAMEKFEHHINRLAEDTAVDRQAVYKAAHCAMQGRVTSVPEAIHMVLGQEVVLFSRGNVWVQVGEPCTWTRYIKAADEQEALANVDVVVEEVTDNTPRAHRLFAKRMLEAAGQACTLPVEGGAAVAVPWAQLTFFDYLAGTWDGRPRRKPAIVGHRTIHPDQEPEAYYYHKLLLHTS